MITASIEVATHPEGGMMIFFGTGKRAYAYALGDTQEAGGSDSFYAIRDNSQSLPITRDRLAERKLLEGTGTDDGGNTRKLRFSRHLQRVCLPKVAGIWISPIIVSV